MWTWEYMVADQMIVELNDKDVQAEVLSKNASLVSLKDKINYIRALEKDSGPHQALALTAL